MEPSEYKIINYDEDRLGTNEDQLYQVKHGVPSYRESKPTLQMMNGPKKLNFKIPRRKITYNQERYIKYGTKSHFDKCKEPACYECLEWFNKNKNNY